MSLAPCAAPSQLPVCSGFCQPLGPASFTPYPGRECFHQCPRWLVFLNLWPHPPSLPFPRCLCFQPSLRPPSLCLIKLKWCHLAKSAFPGLFGWVFSFLPSGAVMSFLSVSLALPALCVPELGLRFPQVSSSELWCQVLMAFSESRRAQLRLPHASPDAKHRCPSGCFQSSASVFSSEARLCWTNSQQPVWLGGCPPSPRALPPSSPLFWPFHFHTLKFYAKTFPIIPPESLGPPKQHPKQILLEQLSPIKWCMFWVHSCHKLMDQFLPAFSRCGMGLSVQWFLYNVKCIEKSSESWELWEKWDHALG